MLNHPKTYEEARKYGYGAGLGPDKISYFEGCCAYEVSRTIGIDYRVSRQCLKRNGHGPNMLYCEQHAMIVGES